MAMTTKIVGKKLHIEIDLETTPKPSTSGKTMIVASTHGNTHTQTEYEGKPLTVSINAYYKP